MGMPQKTTGRKGDVTFMSYVEESLLPNESIVAQTTLHPIIFMRSVWWALLSLLVLLTDALLNTTALNKIAVGFATIAVLGTISALVRYLTAEFAVTDKRVMMKVGWLRRRSLEINLEKVESVTVNQGVFGRLFGYGTLRVRGTGSTDEYFWGIAQPLAFRQSIQQLATA
jgi:uncharacterized membrane protein YdbT with pleckstrin-like domain